MAYNSSKGPQQHGDVKYEGDPLDTQVDFENDFIALKTNGEQRFIVSGSFITSSIPISCSVGITAGFLETLTTTVDGLHISSSLNISGSKFYGDGSTLSGITTAPAGSTTQIQYNNAGSFAGSAALTFANGALNTNILTASAAALISGSLDVSGSIRGKQLYYTTHKFSPGSDALVYLRFDTVGVDAAPTNNNKMVAPHNGKLNKVVWRFEGAGTGASSTTAFSLHAGVTNQQQIQTTPVATVNLTDTFIDDTTYTATFSDTAIFASGDIVGVSIDPAFDPGITVVTCVWEFDQNN